MRTAWHISWKPHLPQPTLKSWVGFSSLVALSTGMGGPGVRPRTPNPLAWKLELLGGGWSCPEPTVCIMSLAFCLRVGAAPMNNHVGTGPPKLGVQNLGHGRWGPGHWEGPEAVGGPWWEAENTENPSANLVNKPVCSAPNAQGLFGYGKGLGRQGGGQRAQVWAQGAIRAAARSQCLGWCGVQELASAPGPDNTGCCSRSMLP